MARLPSIIDLVSWIKGLERRISKLETAPRLGNASISEGGLRVLGDGGIYVENGGLYVDGFGRILVGEGGSILTADGQGRALFYAGGFAETIPGTPQGYGIAFYRLDGSVALLLADDSDDEQVQRVKVYDRNGKTIFAEDRQGDGLEWPVIPIVFAPMDYREWPGTTSTTFEALLQATPYRQHRRAFVRVRHTTDVSDTTGEARVTVNGTQVGSTISVGFGIGTTLVGPFDVPGVHGDSPEIKVEGRVTAGTGKVRATVTRAAAAGWF